MLTQPSKAEYIYVAIVFKNIHMLYIYIWILYIYKRHIYIYIYTYIYDICISIGDTVIGDVVISAPLSFRTVRNWILWGLLQIYNILSSSSQHLHLYWLHIYYTFTTCLATQWCHVNNSWLLHTHYIMYVCVLYILITQLFFSFFFSFQLTPT